LIDGSLRTAYPSTARRLTIFSLDAFVAALRSG
jgi:hypothetical protein